MNRAVRLAVYAIGFIVGFILMGLLHGCATQDSQLVRHPGMKAILQLIWIDQQTGALTAEKDVWFATSAACQKAMPEGEQIARKLAHPNEVVQVACVVAAEDPGVST